MQIRSNASTGILIDPSSSLATNLNINIAATRGYTDEAGSVGVILVSGIFQIKNPALCVHFTNLTWIIAHDIVSFSQMGDPLKVNAL